MVPLLKGKPVPPPVSGKVLESAEFSILSYRETDTTHRRTSPVVAGDTAPEVVVAGRGEEGMEESSV